MGRCRRLNQPKYRQKDDLTLPMLRKSYQPKYRQMKRQLCEDCMLLAFREFLLRRESVLGYC